MSLYSVLLRMGFTEPAGYPAAGELLPHHFTLTRTLPVEGPLAVCFCGTFRRVTPPGRYPASCPVELGLSSMAASRLPQRPPGLLDLSLL